ncbi:MAG: alpha-galactosidase [Clostridia bacterium]|nr:alpha-galactosidase [Clostridia bacterium]
MPIQYSEELRLFRLATPNTAYFFHINEGGFLIHDYYGEILPMCDLRSASARIGKASFSPRSADLTTVPETAPQEYSCNGTGDYRISALQIRESRGNAATDIRYVSHKVYPGKPAIQGQPATYGTDEETTTLEVLTEDGVTGARITLYYTVFEQQDAISRRVKAENNSEKVMDLERIYSLCVEIPFGNWELGHLYGSWAKERTFERKEIPHGITAIESKRGSSSHHHNPFAAIVDKNTSEDTGAAYGFNLVYSSNFSIQVEKDYDGDLRLIMGINPTDFGWRLEPGEAFETPEGIMVFSKDGLGGMSRIFHKLYRNNLCRGPWKTKKRPLLINNWEGTYFNFDEEKIFNIAKDAGELGVEMLVLDDGWFGACNNDKAGLGDWFVNEEKLKGGLSNLSERIHGLGMKFGLWFEPEMINPDSDLFRAHPDWCLQVENRPMSIGRTQYVLDMSREDVRDYLFKCMDDILNTAQIEYVKWDFNRNLTEVASFLLPAERQKEMFHRYVLGVYDLLDRLMTAHPDLLLEGCSGGGGRFDPAMLYYSPQIWTSDDTDAMERLDIQYGTSICYPTSAISSHVSVCPNHQTKRTVPLRTRGDVALAGSFGYELDMTKMSEAEKEEVREQVKEYHKYYDVIHFGDLYRVIPPNGEECAWIYVSEDKSEALLTFVCIRNHPQIRRTVHFRGLDPNKNYADEQGTVLPGSAWMNIGVNYPKSMADGTTFKVYLSEIQ